MKRQRIIPRPVIDSVKCTRCDTCVNICPVTPKAVDWHDGERSHEPRPRLQGRGPGKRGQRQPGRGQGHHHGALLLPHPHGRRHPHVQRQCRACGQGPDPAPGNDPRHRPALQPPLRRAFRHARGPRGRVYRSADRTRRPQDEQELQQLHPALRPGKRTAQADHEDHDQLTGPRRTQGDRRLRPLRHVPGLCQPGPDRRHAREIRRRHRLGLRQAGSVRGRQRPACRTAREIC